MLWRWNFWPSSGLKGWLLDHFRFAVNGPQILDAELEFNQLLPADPLKGFQQCYHFWPRDIAIRQNLTTSCWVDVSNLVASNNATVHDPFGARIPNGKFQRILREFPDEGPEAFAIRWFVVAGEGLPPPTPAPGSAD
jgi:hypothetical protein